MTANRRRRELTVQGDRITDEATVKWWLASMVVSRPTVARLSLTDPSCVDTEATSRGSRAR